MRFYITATYNVDRKPCRLTTTLNAALLRIFYLIIKMTAMMLLTHCGKHRHYRHQKSTELFFMSANSHKIDIKYHPSHFDTSRYCPNFTHKGQRTNSLRPFQDLCHTSITAQLPPERAFLPRPVYRLYGNMSLRCPPNSSASTSNIDFSHLKLRNFRPFIRYKRLYPAALVML